MRKNFIRKRLVSLFVVLCFLTLNVSSVFAQTSEDPSQKVTTYDLNSLEYELVQFLNRNIKIGNSNIDELIKDFYSSKDKKRLISMIQDIKNNKTEKCRTHTLANGLEISFYNNGTFNISNASILKTKLNEEYSMILSSGESWDTGRFTISNTHYGWFGIKLYTVTSEGRFTYSDGNFQAYSYDGDFIKHFAGGFFTVRDLEYDAIVEHPYYLQDHVYYGEFYTKANVSLGLTIYGVGYETTDVVKNYAYNYVDITTGEVLISGDDLLINGE